MTKILPYLAACLLWLTAANASHAATPSGGGKRALPVASQLGAPQKFTSPDQIQRYIKEYRAKPEPKPESRKA